MVDARTIHVVEDNRFQDHRSPPGHPERPERLIAVSRGIARHADRIQHIAPVHVDPAAILRIHDQSHLEGVERSVAAAPAHLDPDTFVSAASLEVASLAAGSMVELARAVARREIETGFAAVRPPGHHAEADRAMGFCIFNNVAIAARALQAEEGVGKLLILDWDVHHGNGTQHSFETDPSVLYMSTHQYPHYPGTGAASEIGRGAGAGTTVNVPMPAGCGDREYVGVFARVLVPIVHEFAPEMILVSCGFDAHRDDPLASMEVTGTGFRDMARIVRALADDVCGGRLAFVLEGGYSASGLEEGTSSVIEALLESDPRIPATPTAEPGSMLRALIRTVASAHRGRFPGLAPD